MCILISFFILSQRKNPENEKEKLKNRIHENLLQRNYTRKMYFHDIKQCFKYNSSASPSPPHFPSLDFQFSVLFFENLEEDEVNENENVLCFFHFISTFHLPSYVTPSPIILPMPSIAMYINHVELPFPRANKLYIHKSFLFTIKKHFSLYYVLLLLLISLFKLFIKI